MSHNLYQLMGAGGGSQNDSLPPPPPAHGEASSSPHGLYMTDLGDSDISLPPGGAGEGV
jgi:hypothetical protein